jgi:phosphoglycerate dehydrogenase-like enzyme
VTAIAILDDYQGYARDRVDWSSLTERADLTIFDRHITGVEELAAALAPFDVVVCMRERTPVTAELLNRLPRLELLVTTGAGNASIDLAAAKSRGVVVSATRAQRYGTEQLAELTWGLILAAVKNLPDEMNAVRDGRWQQGVGTGLSERRLGLVGLGLIGSAVAHVGRAFGMDVCAWSENLTAERAAAQGVTAVGKSELFATSDIVSVHMRLGPRTAGIVGAAELDLMKPTAILVNTARGPLIDEASLVRALGEGRIRGAALDVFGTEPLPDDHPFRRLPNVIATPHIGYVTEEMYEVFYADVIDDIDQYLRGEPVRVITRSPTTTRSPITTGSIDAQAGA